MFNLSVALIVPCYRHGATLERAVNSGLSQTGLAEIVIVDDGSNDNSLEIANRLVRENPRVKVVSTGVNSGAGAARNFGVSNSTAPYLCFLDADDELVGDFFADAECVFRDIPESSVVKCNMEFIDPVKGYILPEFDPRHDSAVLSSACGTIMKRSVFERIGGFSEDVSFRGPFGGEDVAFMQALIRYFQPIGRVERSCYRVWSRFGSHVDRFLERTRLKESSFEFVIVDDEQQKGGVLSIAMSAYLSEVDKRMSCEYVSSAQKAFLP